MACPGVPPLRGLTRRQCPDWHHRNKYAASRFVQQCSASSPRGCRPIRDVLPDVMSTIGDRAQTYGKSKTYTDITAALRAACRPEAGPVLPVGAPSRPALFLHRRYALSLRFAQRCRSEGPHREDWPAFPASIP